MLEYTNTSFSITLQRLRDSGGGGGGGDGGSGSGDGGAKVRGWLVVEVPGAMASPTQVQVLEKRGGGATP